MRVVWSPDGTWLATTGNDGRVVLWDAVPLDDTVVRLEAPLIIDVAREVAVFKSNAVRSCVELHEVELRRFHEVWERFCVTGKPLPATDDPSYVSAEHLGGHVFRAARGYLTWVGEFVGRPVTDVDAETDPVSIARKGRVFVDEVLAAWRRHLALLEDREMTPATRKSRWGQDYTIEQMLEHAVVHPMRHRIQLERLMSA